MNRFALILILSSLTACKMAGGGGSSTTPAGGGGGDGGGGGGGAAPAAAAGPAGTMAEAPHQAFPSQLAFKPGCHTEGYVILDVPEGQAFTITPQITDGCVHVSVMTANGGTNEGPDSTPMMEVCADAIKPVTGKGQKDKTFLSISESGACKGISATFDIK